MHHNEIIGLFNESQRCLVWWWQKDSSTEEFFISWHIPDIETFFFSSSPLPCSARAITTGIEWIWKKQTLQVIEIIVRSGNMLDGVVLIKHACVGGCVRWVRGRWKGFVLAKLEFVAKLFRLELLYLRHTPVFMNYWKGWWLITNDAVQKRNRQPHIFLLGMGYIYINLSHIWTVRFCAIYKYFILLRVFEWM